MGPTHRKVTSMNRILLPLAGWLWFHGIAAPLEASHEPQSSGPVSTRIVEDVWDSSEFCFPCRYDGTTFFARTLRAETSAGRISALDVTINGNLNQSGDAFSLTRDADTHFLFDEALDTISVVGGRDDPTELSGTITGFTPFVRRDVAHIVFDRRLSYEATVTVDFGNNSVQQFTLSDQIIPGFIPEPSTLVLLLVGTCPFVALRRRQRPPTA